MYDSPFNKYTSKRMLEIFSDEHRHIKWRSLWIALAIAQKKLGLPITQSQINEMSRYCDQIQYDMIEAYENQTHHDVMAHILAYGDQCPKARPIIHLGATSCYVTDNTDIMLMRQAIYNLNIRLSNIISKMDELAKRYRDEPMVAYTHFQPAQLTTIGKRICMWAHDFNSDLTDGVDIWAHMKLLGSKGATGTQASFLQLFNGDYNKVKQMDNEIASLLDFDDTGVELIAGQTYSRKLDSTIFNYLSGIAQSASKFATDMRLLAHTNEMREKFDKEQVGSSAMPYKHNPILCERICGIARFIITNQQNAAITAATQWFERTLDDSSNRRLIIPQMFFAADAILEIMIKILNDINININEIRRRVHTHMPHVLTEHILMDTVLHGGDRQDMHKKLSRMTLNDLMEYAIHNDISLEPKDYIGCAAYQVDEFLTTL